MKYPHCYVISFCSILFYYHFNSKFKHNYLCSRINYQFPQNNQTVMPEEKSSSSFNIAIASDWGCDVNAKKTSENIQE